MKVATETTIAMSHGFWAPPLGAAAALPGAGPALIPAPSGARKATAPARPAPGAPPTGRGRPPRRSGVLHDDLHGHPLNHLDVVAGGVLGRQQRERRAGPGLDAVDMAPDGTVRVGVDADVRRLAGPHRGQLRFLVVRRDPDF